jgi:hypothetical protein
MRREADVIVIKPQHGRMAHLFKKISGGRNTPSPADVLPCRHDTVKVTDMR